MARLVTRGKLHDADLGFILVSVVDFTVIRLMLFVETQNQSMEFLQMIYSRAFLQGPLEQEIYMSLPKHFGKTESNKVCGLKKTLYGLHESPRAWYNLLLRDLVDIGLKLLPSALCTCW